ncbi:MAG TPA: tRNA adenosine(34) deaminase TadA [Thermodesulfovibrionales bacterium]|nr:tRNA adenosine(34) deaminase TadA [Thermodesulfovibrionales bacterium]
MCSGASPNPYVQKNSVQQDIIFMKLAIEEAGFAFSAGEVPVGAVLVVDGRVVTSAHNLREKCNDPSAHAELIALREGGRLMAGWRLNDATLYVTKEPCIMCAGAMVNARLGRLVYGCCDVKGGAAESLYNILADSRLNHQVEVMSGILEAECADLLKKFFRERR